ncbi:MAG: ABC transporter permease [Burkholderiales bacterium]|nr:ABC transporter permease [Burkholderiales bacterium]
MQLVQTQLRRVMFAVAGIGIIAAIWLAGGYWIVSNPETASFAKFGLVPTLGAFPELWEMGKIQAASIASGYRLGMGLAIAIAIGVPVGVVLGRSKWFAAYANSPFQFVRMISPLSWTPLAVLIFATWDGAIIFLIAMASVWPVIYGTAAGLAKVDPAWFKVARNLGARPSQLLTKIVWPAIAYDVFSGMRLALGVAWIVLVPAEYLGVTSGLGYAIEDARETLSYHHLTALVLTIGLIGYTLDGVMKFLVKKYSWHH